MRIYGKKTGLLCLSRFVASGRMPHAILITGEEGIGKRTLADYAAMLMLCNGEKKPCMSCNECKRIEQHIHPDVIYPLRQMKEEKYNVKDLVEFMNSCAVLPNDGELRVCIFENAETMNDSCQNALLKFIEEPLPFNRFIFTAADKSGILETIISRVTEIKAEPAERDETLTALIENGIDRKSAERLYDTFGGNIGRCIVAGGEEGEFALFTLAEQISKAVSQNREYDCLRSFSSVKNRDELAVVMKNITDIFGNAAALKVSGKTYGFRSPVSADIAGKLSLKKINDIYGAVMGMLKTMELNPNVQLSSACCCGKMFLAAEKD